MVVESGRRLKVLVADDHDIVRLGVRHLLGSRAEITDAPSLQEARALLAGQAFDLLLLDLGLGDDFSLSALPQLREDFPSLKILVRAADERKAMRRYDPERGVVVHTFHLPATVRDLFDLADAPIDAAGAPSSHDAPSGSDAGSVPQS